MVDDVVMGPPHLPPGSAPTLVSLPYLALLTLAPCLGWPCPSNLAVAVLVELDFLLPVSA
ncbi:hypothetical protein K445DRAFT_319834 [Daldinia sp. EC12]|nr:hypothetical protein K445DRAFT_319834 [Daldinia sp. EC12]